MIDSVDMSELPHDPECPACLDPAERFHSVDRTSPEYLAWAAAVQKE